MISGGLVIVRYYPGAVITRGKPGGRRILIRETHSLRTGGVALRARRVFCLRQGDKPIANSNVKEW